jgi:hypothetical protein
MASQRMPKAVLRPLSSLPPGARYHSPRHIVSTLLPQLAQPRCLPALLDTFHSIQPHIRSVLERCGEESAQSTICRVRRHLTKIYLANTRLSPTNCACSLMSRKNSASHGRESHRRASHRHARHGRVPHGMHLRTAWLLQDGSSCKEPSTNALRSNKILKVDA